MITRSLNILLFSILFIAGAWFLIGDPTNSQIASYSINAAPCQEPLTYRIGTIDDRFNISEQDILAAFDDASNAWSGVIDKTLIEYAEDGEILVNLFYSEDQEISEQERMFRNRLRSAEFEVERLQRQYQQLQSEFDSENREYQISSNQLQEQIEELNRWVTETNARGGFTQSELSRFETEKARINRQSEQLRVLENRLAQKADEVNRLARRLNQMIEDKNHLIDRYNRTFSGQRRFTQGTYRCDSEQCELNIFYFADMDELRLVAAHEIGHALGISHVSNPESIMYHLMGRQSKTGVNLTEEDQQALLNICNW